MPIVEGTRLGPYEVLSPVGAGGMGEVYRARDTRLGRDVAISAIDYSDDDCGQQGRRDFGAIACLDLARCNEL